MLGMHRDAWGCSGMHGDAQGCSLVGARFLQFLAFDNLIYEKIVKNLLGEKFVKILGFALSAVDI